MEKRSRRHTMRLLATSGTALTLDGFGAQEQDSAAERSGRLLIRGGTVVNADGRQRADVLIGGERIEAVGPGLKDPNAKVVDAGGLLVLPGGVDPHTHLHPPFVDDFTTGSQAALAGGITTVGSFANRGNVNRSLLETLESEAERADREAIADVVLHPVVWPPTEDIIREIPSIANRGYTSIKIFMPVRDFDSHLEAFLRLLDVNGQNGVLTMLHCEDAATLVHVAAQLKSAGKESFRYYAESRPVVAEEIATQRAAALCEVTGAPIYVVHLSARRALAACVGTRRRGFPLYVETRPLFLHFTKQAYEGPDGPVYLGQPPLREEDDREALWEGLRHKTIDVVATDHAPWTRAQKMNPAPTITKFRPGAADLQVMLPMLFSEGVTKRRITVERFVALSSYNPAKLFGLQPRKGQIVAGADADIAIWDPELQKTVRGGEEYSRAAFSVYEGWRVAGWPVVTIRRGEIVCERGKVLGKPGSGRMAERGPCEAL